MTWARLRVDVGWTDTHQARARGREWRSLGRSRSLSTSRHSSTALLLLLSQATASNGQCAFSRAASGRARADPPLGDVDRQQQQQPPQAMRGPPSNHAASPPPPPAAAGGAPAPSRAPRRQYATHQYDNSAAMPQQQQPPTHAASPSMQAAPQFFSPGLAASPPPAPQYNGDAISGQFAQMGLNGAPQPAQAQQPMQPQQPMQAPMQQQQPMQQQPQQPAYQQPRAQTQAVNLVGMQLNPQELFSTPPPPIILPPNVSSLAADAESCTNASRDRHAYRRTRGRTPRRATNA